MIRFRISQDLACPLFPVARVTLGRIRIEGQNVRFLSKARQGMSAMQDAAGSRCAEYEIKDPCL